MKVLMISGDPAVLDSDSPVRKRIEEYRNILGELDILLCLGGVKNLIMGFFSGYAMARHKNFDIITAQGPEHWFLAWIFSKIFQIPWQAQIHTDIFSHYFWEESWKNKLRVLLAKFLLPRADGIRVVSERIKNSLVASRQSLVAKISVLPIFIDVKKIQSAKVKVDLHQKYPEYDFIILMASRLTKEKNIPMALRAMRGLTQNGTRTNAEKNLLLIVGDGPELESYKLLVKSYKLENNVIFEFAVDYQTLFSYYKSADLFLLTSNYEGYGRTVVEAMAAGLSVIMTDVGLAGELLIDDLDGKVVPIGNEKALAAAISELADNPAKREEFKSSGLKLLEKWPAKKEYLEKYKNFLLNVI